MLTVDFSRFHVRPGERILDMGCGGGRHAFHLYRLGADVVALDRDASELAEVERMLSAMASEGQVAEGASAVTVQAQAYDLPFPDAHFDKVICAEVLEHIPDDRRAIAELVRVLKPGGQLAVTVPRYLPEKLCWALSETYHQVEGGHVRIYRGSELAHRLHTAGLVAEGSSHTHGLHAPYWWLRCAVGVTNERHPLVRAYHRMLVWDMVRRPWPTRMAERLLDPLIGKSLVLYLTKPENADVPKNVDVTA